MISPASGMTIAAILLTATAMFSSSANASVCEQTVFEGAGYVVCSAEAENAGLRLFWQNTDGKAYRSFSNVARAVDAEGRKLVFAMNAGMYLPDYTPMGLFIANGQELRPADTAEYEGSSRPIPNFYKKPNGVFFWGENGAGVLPTEDFLKLGKKASFATQSGPMLVMENQLHPVFIPGSSDRTRRNGVGICKDGAIRFAISDDKVNFHDFARLFRDHLGCANALFLDGGRGTGLYNPDMRRNDWSWYGGYGPIIGLVE